MKANPICADCQHFKKTPKEDLCTRRGTIHMHNNATGERWDIHLFCQTTRNERNSTLLPWRCGPTARYFNPIEVTTDA